MPGLIAWIRRVFGYEAEPEAGSPPSEPALPAAGMAGQVESAVPPDPQAKALEEDPAVERRKRLAAEAIMENESLMPDLDSSTAQVLLGWGLELVSKVAASSAGLTDLEAEEAMAPRMKATRQLMRAVNNWIGRTDQASTEVDTQSMAKIVENLSVIYGEQITGLDEARLQEILQEIQDLRHRPVEWVASLRQRLDPRAGEQA